MLSNYSIVDLLNKWLKRNEWETWEEADQVLFKYQYLLQPTMDTPPLKAVTVVIKNIWAATCDFQQYGILKTEDSDEPVQPPFNP